MNSPEHLFHTGPEVKMQSVSIIVPCRNEIEHIRLFLEGLLAQDLTGLDVEFWIADGMSTDGTREVLKEWQPKFKELHIIDNQQKTVSHGLNAAIGRARGEVVIRMDVHADYATDYIRQCVNVLTKTGADNVGGPMLTHANTYIQQAICMAFHSRFGCGGASFHDANYEGYVDTLSYGCWRKSTLVQLKGFDEDLVRNQDDELNLRITRSGGKIYQSPAIHFWYSPRSSVSALGRQYGQYGYWKAYVLKKHRIPASWRHLAPGTFGAAIILLSSAALFSHLALILLLGLLTVYAAASMTASVIACRKPANLIYLPMMPLLFAVLHLSYGLSFLRGLYDVATRQQAAQAFTEYVR